MQRVLGARIAGALLVAAVAAVATGCGGAGNGSAAPTGAPDEAAPPPGAGELVVAFAPNPDQPGVQPDPIRLANLTSGDNRDLGEPGLYRHLQFSPDGGLLAAVGIDGDELSLVLYDVETGDTVGDELRTSSLAGLRWSPDGEFLAMVTADAVTFVARSGERLVVDGPGAEEGANQLRWAWSADGRVFGLVTGEGLVLMPIDEGAGINLPAEQFPDPEATWALRTTDQPREIGLVDLAPVSGLAEARAEHPLTIVDGQIVAGEARLVSIYDWGTLPSPAFDAATAQRFPAIRKTCDPCRTADGSSSMLLFWLAPGAPTPGPEVDTWPPETGTYLALEASGASAVAVDLGIAPSGPLDIESWRPVYDAVRAD